MTADKPPPQAMRWFQDDYMTVRFDGLEMDRLAFERLTQDLGRKPPTRAQVTGRRLALVAVLGLLVAVAPPVAVVYVLLALVLACKGQL